MIAESPASLRGHRFSFRGPGESGVGAQHYQEMRRNLAAIAELDLPMTTR